LMNGKGLVKPMGRTGPSMKDRKGLRHRIKEETENEKDDPEETKKHTR